MTTTQNPQRSPQTPEGAPMTPSGSHDADATTEDTDVNAAVTASYARAKLISAADLVAHVRGLVAPGSAQPSDGQPRASSAEAPMPIRADPLEASDRVYAHLLNWVRFWAAVLQVQPPVAATYAWATEDGPQGFRSTVTPLGAWGLTQTLTTWLLLRHDAIRQQPDAGDYFTAVDDFLGQLRARFPMRAPQARPTLPRACPVCSTETMTIERRGEQVSDLALVCGYCAFEGDARALLKDRGVRSLVTDIRIEEAPEPAEWWTKQQAVDQMRLTPRTLNRYITDDGLETQTKDGVVWVKADELRDLWRAKQVRRLATNMRRPVGAQPAPAEEVDA